VLEVLFGLEEGFMARGIKVGFVNAGGYTDSLVKLLPRFSRFMRRSWGCHRLFILMTRIRHALGAA
jgi:hypothetical protein